MAGIPTLPEKAARPPGAPGVFYRNFKDFLRDLSGTAKRFWAAVLLTGVAAGLGAVLLVALLRAVQTLAWGVPDSLHEASEAAAAAPIRRLLIPAAAGVMVMLVAMATRHPLLGHGTSGVIEAIWITAGRLPLAKTLLRGIVSIISVGMGASLGREGALLQGGAAAGSALGRRLGLSTDQLRLLVACGASAGMGAAYNMPIGATVFGLEVFLGSFALELFGPVAVSCVVATVISRVLIANHPTYIIPSYDLSLVRHLLLAPLIGGLIGAAAALFIKVVDLAHAAAARIPRHVGVFLPPFGMLALGALAIAYPQLLGNGYGAVNAELLSRLPLGLLIILPFLKLAATSLCSATGVPGGMFTPSLFYGALLGGLIGELAQRLVPEAGAPSAYALVGMGAALAGTTHASLSAAVMIFELTGNYGVILPLMLACAAATAVSRRLVADSLYTAPLRRRNIRLPERPRPEWLGATPARAVMRGSPPRVEPSTRFEEVLLRLYGLPAGQDLYVVGPDDRLLGILSLDALKGHIVDQRDLAVVIAADVMLRNVIPVALDTPLTEVAARFGESALDNLPVTGPDGKLAGWIAAADVLRRGRF